jgi:hypothetical protein
MNNHHPESPHALTELQMYEALTSGYRWVAALGPSCEDVRTLVPTTQILNKLDPADPSAPIFQIHQVRLPRTTVAPGFAKLS